MLFLLVLCWRLVLLHLLTFFEFQENDTSYLLFDHSLNYFFRSEKFWIAQLAAPELEQSLLSSHHRCKNTPFRHNGYYFVNLVTHET